nr:hypothetical protein CFP56_21972 [Quercus suber]
MVKQLDHPVSAGDVLNLSRHATHSRTRKEDEKGPVAEHVVDKHSANIMTLQSNDQNDGDAGIVGNEKCITNASSLSDDHDWNALDEERLAGLDFEDDFEDDDECSDDEDNDEGMSMNENKPAVTGADLDDNYDAIGSDAGSLSEENDNVLLRVAAEDLREEYESLEQELLDQNIVAIAVQASEEPPASLNDIGMSQAQLKSLYSPYFGPQRGTILDLNEDPFAGLPPNDSLYREMWEVAESSMWRKQDPAQARESSAESASNKKRVRFEETKAEDARSRRSSSSSEEDQDPGEAFPDLFTALEEDASARHNVIVGESFGIDFGDTESYYDYEEDERLALDNDDNDSSSDGSSACPAEDEGDTTDEETEEEHLARLEKMRKIPTKVETVRDTSSTPVPATSAGSRKSSARRQNAARPVTPKAGKGLRMGTFALDPARAAMSVDASNKKIVVQPPTRPAAHDKDFWVRARKANGASRPSSPTSSPGGWEINTPGSARPPLTPASTLGTMFDGNLDLLRASEPPTLQPSFTPAFTPKVPLSHHSSFSFHEESDDDDVDMEDFIDMDDFASESDEVEAAGVMSPAEDPFETFSSTATPTRPHSGTLNHLEHQPSLVGSFRLNQNHARHVSSLASHPATRASTLESNALQKGRRGAANAPMTPARKKRISQDLSITGAGVKKSFGSPLAPRRPRSRGQSLSGPGMQETLSQSLMQ